MRNLLRRLLKAVWRTKPTTGQQHWLEWAHRLPRSAFVIWLAGHVADVLMTNRRHTVTVQQMIDAVDEDRTGMMQSDAEHFIEAYYFGYPSSDPHMYRLIGIFRRVVKRKLRRHFAKDS